MSRPDLGAIERMPWPMPIFNAVSRATIYRPRIGNRSRAFASMAAAIDYEDGYGAYPRETAAMASQGPARQGWLDAEREQQLRDDVRADKAFEEGQQ
jgi:hypothetical protein